MSAAGRPPAGQPERRKRPRLAWQKIGINISIQLTYDQFMKLLALDARELELELGGLGAERIEYDGMFGTFFWCTVNDETTASAVTAKLAQLIGV
jgi:hypothetical protein